MWRTTLRRYSISYNIQGHTIMFYYLTGDQLKKEAKITAPSPAPGQIYCNLQY